MSEEDVRKAVEPLVRKYYYSIIIQTGMLCQCFSGVGVFRERRHQRGPVLRRGDAAQPRHEALDGRDDRHRAGAGPQAQPQGDDQQPHQRALPQGDLSERYWKRYFFTIIGFVAYFNCLICCGYLTSF